MSATRWRAQAAIGLSALDANYVDIGGGSFHPATNYGTEDQFSYATSNFINGSGFFNTFSFAGDADFFGNDRSRARTGLLGFTLNGNGRIGLEAAEATERHQEFAFCKRHERITQLGGGSCEEHSS